MTDGFLYLNTYYIAKIRKKTKHPIFSPENFKFPSKKLPSMPLRYKLPLFSMSYAIVRHFPLTSGET